MKITSITDDFIEFDDGRRITYDHAQDCCEWNYADFNQLDDLARDYDYDHNLQFEGCEYGFRFGDNGRMFFVPCYSSQNGYYTTAVDIYFDGKCVLNTEGEWID